MYSVGGGGDVQEPRGKWRARGGLMGAFVAAAALLIPPGTALGATVCYDESPFPAVVHLERRGSGLRAALGPKWWPAGSRGADPERVPTLSYDPSHGWKIAEHEPLPRSGDPPPCAALVPRIPLTTEEAISLRPHIEAVPLDLLSLEQSIGACHQVGDVIWFGISFYDGEGSEGVGGVGRYDLATKRLEVRRPEELRDASVSHLVHDGDSLWIATHGRYECVGFPPASGLIRYEWDEREVDRQLLCGFVYHGMVLLDGDLWVASDLGLARGTRAKYGLRTWQNLVPTPDQREAVRQTSCWDLYASLLDSLPAANTVPGDPSPWSQLFRNLAKFDPEFLGYYVLQQRKRDQPAATIPSRDGP